MHFSLKYIFILFYQHVWTQQSDVHFPGFQPGATTPLLARGFNLPLANNSQLKGGLLYGPTNYIPNPPKDAFLPVKVANGQTYNVPRIFYSKVNSGSSVDGKLKTPDLTNPVNLINDFVSTDGKARQDDNVLGGVYVPLPWGLQPLAFQLIDENRQEDQTKLGLGLKSDLVPTTKPPNVLMKVFHNTMNFLSQSANSDRTDATNSEQNDFLSKHSQNDQLTAGTSTNAPNVVLKAFQSALDYVDQNVNQQTSEPRIVQTGLFNRYPESQQRLNQPSSEKIVSRRNLLLQANESLSSPDFFQRLVSNVMNTLKVEPPAQEIPTEEYPKKSAVNLDVGGVREIKDVSKGTGLYMSIPFVQPSYFGSYVNYNKAEDLKLAG